MGSNTSEITRLLGSEVRISTHFQAPVPECLTTVLYGQAGAPDPTH